jgi:hypothetical protein
MPRNAPIHKLAPLYITESETGLQMASEIHSCPNCYIGAILPGAPHSVIGRSAMSQPRFALATRFLSCLFAALLVVASAYASDDGRKVVGGYFEEWSIYFANFNIANLQANGVADRLTHLNYAFGGVNSSGCFVADSWAYNHGALHRAAVRQLCGSPATEATAPELEGTYLFGGC